MLFWIILKVALKSLLANKLRSFLAILGIIIGVGSVIAMLAMGAGAQRSIMGRISAMGTNLLVVRPGQSGGGGVMSGTAQSLTLEDAQAILHEVAGVYEISPTSSGNAQVKYYNKNTRTSILGCAPTYFSVRNFEIATGRIFSDLDVDRMARVAILGPIVVNNLFGEDDPIGETIKIKGLNFMVIGITKSKGDQGMGNPDDQIFIPYTTAMKKLFGNTHLQAINIRASDNNSLAKVQQDATALLRKRHRLDADKADDFEIRNQADLLETASSVSRTFTILLGSIASISLLVGGIGIMNIMLVTVTERTREIGVRKAIGAKNRDILFQFLLEAILMSGLGGLLGVAAGIASSQTIEQMTQFRSEVQLSSVLMALAFSAGVGIFFGYYPAQRASRLHPIDALRYE